MLLSLLLSEYANTVKHSIAYVAMNVRLHFRFLIMVRVAGFEPAVSSPPDLCVKPDYAIPC